jgi:hypothetical protein
MQNVLDTIDFNCSKDSGFVKLYHYCIKGTNFKFSMDWTELTDFILII